MAIVLKESELDNMLRRSVVLYVLFGVLTTLLNTVVYYVLYDVFGCANVMATVFAWFLSVIFAFITNKYFVFSSKSWNVAVMLKELRDFFTCRILTGLLDVGMMYVMVDKLHGDALFWKLASNGIVIVLNYIASKFVVFAKK